MFFKRNKNITKEMLVTGSKYLMRYLIIPHFLKGGESMGN